MARSTSPVSSILAVTSGRGNEAGRPRLRRHGRPGHHRRVRIAYLCEFPTRSGGEAMLLELLGRSDRMGVDPVVLCPPGGSLAADLDRLEIARRDFVWKEAGRDVLERAAAVAPLVKRLGAELVHANTLALAAVSGTLAADGGPPAVAHARDIGRMSAARARRVAGNAAVITVSGAVHESVVGAGVPEDRLRLIADGVDADRLDPARIPAGALRRELGVGAETPVVLTVGMLDRRKAADVFFDAAASVATRRPEALFVHVGSLFTGKAEARQFADAIGARVDAPPLAGRARLLGWRDDAAALIRDADVVVSCARQEPLGVVILEAMALARPLVATDVGGTAEQIEDGVSGRLVPAEDAAALADAVWELLEDPRNARALGERARERARERFDPDRAADAVAQVQREAAGR